MNLLFGMLLFLCEEVNLMMPIGRVMTVNETLISKIRISLVSYFQSLLVVN